MNKKSTITSGSAKEKTKRVVKTQREKNILWGNKFLRGLAKALKTPGVKLNLPADAPRYHANDNGQLVRVLNGEESTGVMKNGLFVPDEVKTSTGNTISVCKIKLDDLHKVEATSVIPLAQNASDIILAIIKVNEADYCPTYVHLRTNIGPHMFTGELKFGDLESLERDPKVESVSINEKLKSAK